MARSTLERDALLLRTFAGEATRGELKRADIIKAFIDCVVEGNLAAATFERVGQRLKMKAPHVAYYFKDRDALLEGAIKFVIAKGQEATIQRIAKARGSAEALLGMVHGAFDWYENEPKNFAILMLLYHLSSYDPKFKAMNHEIRLAGENRIESLLAELGHFTKKLERRKRAQLIHAVITGSIIGWATTQSGLSLAELRKRTEEAVKELAHL